MAAKILANLIVIGGSILARGVVAAYRQALQNATKNGVAQETIQNVVHRGSKMMTVEEAQLILGVTEKTFWEDIVKKFETMHYKKFCILRRILCDPCLKTASKCTFATVSATLEPNRRRFCVISHVFP
ncbi:putative mitochondrial import inner membrane translocase subunit Tim16 [Medicago truncatula]|uniref:Putative mitochondrial import inner membrane translocase subunit Tim16 n=1 Tax=Medicago truncatula TaxID=3880 RepID=A0A396IET9_MEDTR|nr:putative mitochondrial import inner membrane translocase subunit Tim16 [Medicago truncatula]